jgi:hypothetical protein
LHSLFKLLTYRFLFYFLAEISCACAVCTVLFLTILLLFAGHVIELCMEHLNFAHVDLGEGRFMLSLKVAMPLGNCSTQSHQTVPLLRRVYDRKVRCASRGLVRAAWASLCKSGDVCWPTHVLAVCAFAGSAASVTFDGVVDCIAQGAGCA